MAASSSSLRDGNRMSDAEALMWNVETDPALRSSFLNVTILEHSLDLARLRRRLARATATIPRLRQRVVSAPARLGPPAWVADPTFDLDYHVRHLAVPPPGDERALLDLAARLFEDPFDRARPLWQFTVVDGLAGGRAALLSKLHHTIADGVGAVRLSMEFIDLSPDDAGEARDGGRDGGRDGADGAYDAHDGAGAHDVVEPSAEGTAVAPTPGLVTLAAATAAHNARRQLGAARRAATTIAGVATHPARVVPLVGAAVETGRSLGRQLGQVEAARSPLWTGRSLARRFEAASLDLDAIRRTAKALGGTVNDVFVTGIAGAAGAYHRARGVEVGDLRMAMPVATRHGDRRAGGNAFAPTRVLVPAGTADAAERFAIVRERLSVTKTERALGLVEGVAGVLNLLPTALLVRVARQQAETVDFATSNLRGSPVDLYVAGARVVSNHPMGPTAGTAFNATVLGYRDQLDLGLNCDAAAIDDPAKLKECVLDAFAELAALGR